MLCADWHAATAESVIGSGVIGHSNATAAESRLSGPTFVAVDEARGRVFWVESTHTVRLWDAKTDAVYTIAGTCGMNGRAEGRYSALSGPVALYVEPLQTTLTKRRGSTTADGVGQPTAELSGQPSVFRAAIAPCWCLSDRSGAGTLLAPPQR